MNCAQPLGRYAQRSVVSVAAVFTGQRSIRDADGGDNAMPESNPLLRKEAAHLNRYRTLALKALKAGQKAVSLRKIEAALAAKNTYAVEIETARGLLRVDEVFRETLPTFVFNLLVAAGNVAGAELPIPPDNVGPAVLQESTRVQAPLRFDRSNPDAIRWAERYASDLIRDVTAESRDAINHVIAMRLSSGASTADTAKVVQMSVGLTEPHAAAVMNLNARLLDSPGKLVKAGALQFRVPEKGMSRKDLDRALTRYSERLTKVRANNIARTATRTASSEGQREMWRQARGKGLLTGAERRQWIASSGACTICSALGGETTTIEGTFSNGLSGPPAHGSCTCTQSLTYD